jgi:hypothetical protein
LLEILEAVGIEIVRQNATALFRRWDGEGAHASKDISNDFLRTEELDEAFMFRMKPRIPVDLGKVEGESTAGFVLVKLNQRRRKLTLSRPTCWTR